MHKLFYPKAWLEATGYFNTKRNSEEGSLLFGANPQSSSSSNIASLVAVALVCSCVSLMLGVMWGSHRSKTQTTGAASSLSLSSSAFSLPTSFTTATSGSQAAYSLLSSNNNKRQLHHSDYTAINDL